MSSSPREVQGKVHRVAPGHGTIGAMTNTLPTVEPVVLARTCGGWLATTPDDHRWAIGVTGDTEEEARSLFAIAVLRWHSLLYEEA